MTERLLSVNVDPVDVESRFENWTKRRANSINRKNTVLETNRAVTHIRGHHEYTERERIVMDQYQSLDFPVIDNQIWREHSKEESRPQHALKTLGKWLICFMIGFITGLMAYSIKTVVDNMSHIKFNIAFNYIAHNNRMMAFLSYYGINLAFVVSSCICIMLAGPLAGGSGIPEVKAYLNGVRVPNSLGVKTLLGKTISLVLGYGSGLVLGPEGPMIHIGSMIGAAVGQLKSKTLKCYPKLLWKYHNARDRRDFISVGAAAGIAAAFGAPIGGVLFSLEEASSFWSKQLTWRTFFGCFIATFTVNAIMQGVVLQVHDYGLLTFGFSEKYLYRYSELLPFALLGVAGGLLGALFVHLSIRLYKLRDERLGKRKLFRLLEAIAIITLTSILCFGLSLVFPCKPLSDVIEAPPDVCDIVTPVTTLVQFTCPEGYYSDFASLVLTTPDKALNLLYSRSHGVFSPLSLCIFSILWFALVTVTMGLWVAGGLFIPFMLVGAGYGRLVGDLVLDFFPTVYPPIDPSIYALVGSAGMMAGFSRLTISLVVIIVELTEGTQYLLPSILVVMLGKWVGDAFNEGIYEHLIELKCIPFLGTQPSKKLNNFRVVDVMSTDVITLTPKVQVRYLLELLQNCQHNGFPILETQENQLPHLSPGSVHSPWKNTVNGFAPYLGLILRSQILVLLDKKVFCGLNDFYDPSTISYEEFTQQLAKAPPPLNKMIEGLTENEKNMYLDLTPYLNLSLPTVSYTASYNEAYKIFRTMGLRHLVVLGRNQEVAGILTRKDLI